MTVKSLLVKLGVDTSAMEAGFKQADGYIQKHKEQFKKAGRAITVAGAAIGGIVGMMVKTASDAQETYAKFGTVFKDVFSKAETSAKNLASSYGLSTLAAKDMLGATGDLLTGLGVMPGIALDLSEKTQQLAVDLASFTNFSGGAKGASEALTKAMLGERESIKSLGIVITEEMVNERLLAEGKDDLTGLARKQAAAEATLAIAYDQSKNAVGDYERTSGDLANVGRTLKNRFEDLTAELGAKLIPVVTSIAVKTKDVVEKVTAWVKENPRLAGTLIKIAGAVGILATIFGPILIMLPALSTGFTMLWGAITGPVGIVIAAVAAIAGAVYLIYKNWEPIKKFFIGLWEDVSGFFVNAFNSIKKKILDWAISIASILAKIPVAKKLAGPWKESLESMRAEMDKTVSHIDTKMATIAVSGEQAVAALDWMGMGFSTAAKTATESIDTVAEASTKIAELIKAMNEEIKKETLSEYEYSKWALEQKYLDRIAAIEAEKATEAEKNAALALARQTYRLEQAALDKEHRQKEKERQEELTEAMKTNWEEYWAAVREQMEAHRQIKAEITDSLNQLTMSELQYKLWSFDQEYLKRKAHIEKTIKDEKKKAELLGMINKELILKKEKAQEEHTEKMTQLEENTLASLTALYTEFLDTTLESFELWGEGTKGILEIVGGAFMSLASSAVQAIQSIVTAELASAARTVIAEKAKAIANIIAKVMAAVPFPFNLAIVGGAIAAVTALFSRIKLGEGGIVTKPTLATIGERGPEAVIPLNKIGGGVLQPAPVYVKMSVYNYGDISNVGDLDEISDRLSQRLTRQIERGRRS